MTVRSQSGLPRKVVTKSVCKKLTTKICFVAVAYVVLCTRYYSKLSRLHKQPSRCLLLLALLTDGTPGYRKIMFLTQERGHVSGVTRSVTQTVCLLCIILCPFLKI